MRPLVPLQLVRPREPLAAEDPVADEGPLAAVPPQVRPQVRRLAVQLAAARNVANVQLPPHARLGQLLVPVLAVLAVGARARHPPQPRLAGARRGAAVVRAGRTAVAWRA